MKLRGLAAILMLQCAVTLPAFAQEEVQETTPETIQEKALEPVQQVAPEVTEEVADDEGKFNHFENWLDELRAEALNAGITQDVIDDALEGIEEPSEDIVEKDRSQPEMKKTFKQYVSNVFNIQKVKAARVAWKDNKRVVGRVSDAYGVQPQVLLALWGIESNFGLVQGNHSIIDSLVTLAYDGRRSTFFRGQLLDAMRIMQQEKIKSSELLGSWAGAMGQVQFMPSSFLRYAVDFSEDGKKDIWTNNADALASMANYLKSEGWDGNMGWGIAVSLPKDSKVEWLEMKERLPLATWKKFGVRQRNGSMLTGIKEEARLILLDQDPNTAYLVYPNFDVIMKWNRSTYFATTVGLLSDAIGEEE